ncbi:MAG: hypothetical protein MUE40_01330 [Anaerolineae bacterium]|jgi:hypothetical protein|nr:hypothetical protein [Anaerolineae bacterium]
MSNLPETDLHAEKPKNTPPAAPWHVIWLKVLTAPATATFDELLTQPGISAARALRWVFLSALAAGALALLVTVILYPELFSFFLGFLPQFLLSLGLNAVLTVAIFALSSLWLQGFARLAGGTGSYTEYHYALAASFAPLIFVRTLVALAGGSFIFGAAVALYQLVLAALALRAVNDFTWGRTLTTLLAALGALLLLLVPLLVVGVALLVTLLTGL